MFICQLIHSCELFFKALILKFRPCHTKGQFDITRRVFTVEDFVLEAIKTKNIFDSLLCVF